MDDSRLFLVSTPLHLLVSIAIVSRENIQNAHLVFIDQVEGRANPYLDTLRAWDANPFITVDVFYRPQRSLIKKMQSRRATFSQLKCLVEQYQPAHIYCGNDRRIEFQYMMHIATSLGMHAKGYYMDEGTFTYVGRKASDSFSDKVLDNAVKKLAYGFWWKHPATVGASSWIDTVYASFPDIIHPLLKSKQVIHLTLDYWQHTQVIEFCRRLVAFIGIPPALDSMDVLITLPHESILQSNKQYQQRILEIVSQYLGQGLKVGLKYHPRDAANDALSIAAMGDIVLIPRQLPFEALLPMVKTGAVVLGDFSTTLISTRLLRPDLTVQAMDHGGQSQSNDFIELYKKMGITIIQY